MKKPTILIVDDEDVVVRYLTSQLTELGFDLAGAVPTSEEALPLVERLRPDLGGGNK